MSFKLKTVYQQMSNYLISCKFKILYEQLLIYLMSFQFQIVYLFLIHQQYISFCADSTRQFGHLEVWNNLSIFVVIIMIRICGEEKNSEYYSQLFWNLSHVQNDCTTVPRHSDLPYSTWPDRPLRGRTFQFFYRSGISTDTGILDCPKESDAFCIIIRCLFT